MHAQRRRTRLESHAVTFERFAIKIDAQPLGHLDFDPWQTGANKHVVDPEAIAEQRLQGAHQLLWRRQNTDIQQAIIGQRLRAQHVSTAGLSAIADTQCQQLATPVKIRPLKFAVSGMQLAES